MRPSGPVSVCRLSPAAPAAGRALYHQAGQAWARLGLDQVGRVGWDEQRHVLVLTGLAPAVPARTVLHRLGHAG